MIKNNLNASIPGCSGYLTNVVRIKANLVYIESDGARIGTGVINTAFPDEIFTPVSKLVKKATKFFEDLTNVFKKETTDARKKEKPRPTVIIRSGINESSRVIVFREYDERVIKLIVSIHQENL